MDIFIRPSGLLTSSKSAFSDLAAISTVPFPGFKQAPQISTPKPLKPTKDEKKIAKVAVMGLVCCPHRQVSDDCLLHYPAKLTFRIGKQDFAGRPAGCDSVSAVLTRPEDVPGRTAVKTSLQSMVVTSCVLPGLDPRGTYRKTCQDAVYWTEKGGTLLVAVFDGHGDYGDQVAHFCTSFVSTYFSDHFSHFPVSCT